MTNCVPKIVVVSTFLAIACNGYCQGQLWGVTTNGGTQGGGTLYHVQTDGTQYTVVKEFIRPPMGPSNRLIVGADHQLYGMAAIGGTKNHGVIFKIKEDGTGFTVVHTFSGPDGKNPLGGLTLGNDGSFVGMTESGGTPNEGIIFKVDPDGSNYSTLYEFTNEEGGHPEGNLVVDDGGELYGMTSGEDGAPLVFKIKADGSGYTHLHEFTGDLKYFYNSSPALGTDGYIYGVSQGGGTFNAGGIFKVDKNGSNYQVIYSFDAWSNPVGQLLIASDGKIYGFYSGGVYRIDEDGQNFEALASLSTGSTLGSLALIEDPDGVLYGIANGNSEVFKMNKDGSGFTVLHPFDSGDHVQGQLVLHPDGELFGVSQDGGNTRVGFIYTLSRDGTAYKQIYDFNPDGERYLPGNSLVNAKDNKIFYGFTAGGPHGCGSIFSIQPDGTDYQNIYDFNTETGCTPVSLTVDTNGNLWGVVKTVGSNNFGGIFEFNTHNATFDLVHELSNDTGWDVRSRFVEDTDGNLIGTSSFGGLNGSGTMYRIKSGSNDFEKLIDFDTYNDTLGIGASPSGTPLLGQDGYLYGVTYTGGAYGGGVLYKVKPDGSDYARLHSFDKQISNGPIGRPYLHSDGFLYGITNAGMQDPTGAVYRIKADGSDFSYISPLHQYPNLLSEITPDSASSTLYGVLEGYSTYGGAVFAVGMDGSDYRVIYSFFGDGGFMPQGNLLFEKATVTATKQLDEQQLKLYPNPATSSIRLPRLDTGFSLTLTDLRGQSYPVVPNCDDQGCILNVSALQPGVYLLRLVSGNGHLTTSKFIKE